MTVALALIETLLLSAAAATTTVSRELRLLAGPGKIACAVGHGLALAACCIVAFYYSDLYDLRIVPTMRAFTARLLLAAGVGALLFAGYYALSPASEIGARTFAVSLLAMLGLLLSVRLLFYSLIRRGPFEERVVILGTGPLARTLLATIEGEPRPRYAIVGLVDDGGSGAPPSRYPVLGPMDQLAKILDEVRCDRIVCALAERRGRLPVRELLERLARGMRVEDGIETYERLTGKLAIESIAPSSLLFSRAFRASRVHLALARAVSLTVSLLALVATAPLVAVIAAAIKLDSRGPVLYVQERLGRHGRRFKLLKFRTMVSSEGPASAWVRDNQDRITRLGRWLRKFRCDELPQFFNILRGDMNLVGPRPHPASNFSLFTTEIPYYVLRTSVRPGLTGWAQVRYGYANDLEEEIEKARYDLYYIKHFSVWFDLHILVDTIKTVICGHGSAHASEPAPRAGGVIGAGSNPVPLAPEPDVASLVIQRKPSPPTAPSRRSRRETARIREAAAPGVVVAMRGAPRTR